MISTILLSILPAVAWGSFWAFVRDQDGIRQGGSGSGNPLKEIGVGAMGLPFWPLIALYLGPSWEAVWIGAGAWALTAGAWSLGHAVTSYVTGRPKRALEADTPEALLNLAIGGALVTAGPALALAWSGHIVLAGLCLLAGAAKVLTYKLGWILRPVPGRRPEATFIGHVLHGAIAVGGAVACIVAAGG